MSTNLTIEEQKANAKTQIEADATTQKNANTTAYNEAIAGYESAAQIRKDNVTSQVNASNAALTQRADKSKKDTSAQYDEIYNANAVNQYIAEERVAENMANMGLTNSGLTATQLTAIQTGRGNADNRARLQEQKAIETIEFELSQGLAENEQRKINYFADIDATLAQQKATASANLTSQNAAIDSAASAAIDAAYKEIDDAAAAAAEEAEKAQADAVQTRADEIELITNAAKTLNIDKGDESGALGLIKRAADQYNLSQNEIATMCGAAGINYDTYRQRFMYGGDDEVKWAQNHSEIASGQYSKTNSSNYLFIKDIWDDAKTDRDKKYIIEDFVTAGVFTRDDANQVWLYLPTIQSETVATNPELVLSQLMDANKLNRLSDTALAFLMCMVGIGT